MNRTVYDINSVESIKNISECDRRLMFLACAAERFFQ